jgi:hypothetical protein
MKSLVTKLLSKLFPPRKLLTAHQMAILDATIRVN